MTKKEAIRYSIILWEKLAQKPISKNQAIHELIIKNELPETASLWMSSCPLCDWSNQNSKSKIFCCDVCPWPNSKFENETQCLSLGSPFSKWCQAKDINNKPTMLKSAKEVVELLKLI